MTPTPPIHALLQQYPLLQRLQAAEELAWFNPAITSVADALPHVGLDGGDIAAAAARLQRFAPYLAAVFPETAAANGLIESPLRPIAAMQAALDTALPGHLWLKMDSHLPVSGSIKARGGIYEVLAHAEQLALAAGWLRESDDYRVFNTPAARAFFSQYTIAVGSTGNLGLSIGIMAAKLGFQAAVHMSADARQWKKERLRSLGVRVVEYAEDYGIAVAQGRAQAAADPNCFFIDDENSRTLFLGYAVAGERLKQQLAEQSIRVDAEHPLFVYLPCGVGGGPGGVAFGLKMALGDHVHCLFVEPTQSPCMLLGVHTGLHEAIAVQDLGLSNRTAADGLAVGRPSGFVGRAMAPLIDGYVTVSDKRLFHWLRQLQQSENILLEPSALAGFAGLPAVATDQAYRARLNLSDHILRQANHIVWATGGGMVPAAEMAAYLASTE